MNASALAYAKHTQTHMHINMYSVNGVWPQTTSRSMTRRSAMSFIPTATLDYEHWVHSAVQPYAVQRTFVCFSELEWLCSWSVPFRNIYQCWRNFTMTIWHARDRLVLRERNSFNQIIVKKKIRGIKMCHKKKKLTPHCIVFQAWWWWAIIFI